MLDDHGCKRVFKSTVLVLFLFSWLAVFASAADATGPTYPKPSISSVSPSSGTIAGRTKVTLRGKNFRKVRYVEFGRMKAPKLNVVSSSKLTIDAPKHRAGKVSIEVVTRAGPSLGASFKYLTRPKTTSPALRGWSPAVDTKLPLIGGVGQNGQLKDVSCLAATSGSSPWCVAIDTWGAAVVDDNGTWSAEPTVFGPGGPSGVSCVSQSLCVVVDFQGNIWLSTDKGGEWAKDNDTNGNISLDSRGFGDVSCTGTSVTFCAAVSQDGKLFTFDVTSGSVESVTSTQVATIGVGGEFIGNVSCTSATFCVTSVNISTDGSSQDVDTYTWNGTAWSSATLLEAADWQNEWPDEVGISCPTSTTCVTIDAGGNLFVTDDAAAAWTEVLSAIDPGVPNWISCQSATLCTEVDGAGDVVDISRPGMTSNWSASIPTEIDASPLIAISCPATRADCIAVDNDDGADQYAPGSGTGTPQVNTESLHDLGSGGLTSVSCISTARCVGVGDSGQAEWTRDGGRSWTLAEGVSEAGLGGTMTGGHVDRNIPFSDLSCAANGFCAAVDEDGVRDGNLKTYDQVFVSGDAGVDWTNLSTVTGTNVATVAGDQGVSCTDNIGSSGDFCVFVDEHGDAYAYRLTSAPTRSDAASGGLTAWDAGTTPVTSGTPLTAVSCAAAAKCVAVDSLGEGYVLSGSRWSLGVRVNAGHTTHAISCVSGTDMCTAVGTLDTNSKRSDIVKLEISGSRLTPTSLHAAALNNYSLSSISCATTMSCFASGDQRNDVLAFDPASASTYAKSLHVTSFPHADSLRSVTSVSRTFAMVADLNGHVYTYASH
jgi:IPT/TIG domain